MTTYSNWKLKLTINEYVHSERDRIILRRKLIDNLSLERIAEELDMSERQVRRIVRDFRRGYLE